jgi:hypothetical protein
MSRASLFFILPLLTACSVFGAPSRHNEPGHQSVMSLWELYQDCQKSHDVEAALSTAKRLRQSADLQVGPVSDVPGALEGFVERQPVRTTVDPKAMAASCTLQAARASLDAGRNQEAEQLLSAVVHTYPESEYAFYVRQAKIWMKDLPDADLNSERTPASNL